MSWTVAERNLLPHGIHRSKTTSYTEAQEPNTYIMYTMFFSTSGSQDHVGNFQRLHPSTVVLGTAVARKATQSTVYFTQVGSWCFSLQLIAGHFPPACVLSTDCSARPLRLHRLSVLFLASRKTHAATAALLTVLYAHLNVASWNTHDSRLKDARGSRRHFVCPSLGKYQITKPPHSQPRKYPMFHKIII